MKTWKEAKPGTHNYGTDLWYGPHTQNKVMTQFLELCQWSELLQERSNTNDPKPGDDSYIS